MRSASALARLAARALLGGAPTAAAAASASASLPSTSAAAFAAPALSFSHWHRRRRPASTKATTGIVGLAVDPAARATAAAKLREVSAALDAAGVPADAQYRKGVDGLVAQRLAIIQSGATDSEVEAQLGIQLEQVSRQCEDELELVAKMAQWKPWAVAAGTKVELRVEKPVEAA